MTNPADQVLTKLKERAATGMSAADVRAVVEEAMRTMQGDLTAGDIKLYAELEALAKYIAAAKQEIASIRAEQISGEHINTATDELDAVVGATEDATNKIMNACDEIMTIAGTLEKEPNEKLMNIVTGIYEACNFQDITGQRITKVVRTLKHIEDQVQKLVSAFGVSIASSGGTASKIAVNRTASVEEKELLNGPALPNNAINQEEIDKLMASFDAPADK